MHIKGSPSMVKELERFAKGSSSKDVSGYVTSHWPTWKLELETFLPARILQSFASAS